MKKVKDPLSFETWIFRIGQPDYDVCLVLIDCMV
jgi:hypothetical protein